MKGIIYYTIDDLHSVVQLALYTIRSHHQSLRWQLDESGANHIYRLYDDGHEIGELHFFLRGSVINMRPISPINKPSEPPKDGWLEDALSDENVNRYVMLDNGIWEETDRYLNSDNLFFDIVAYVTGRWNKEIIQNPKLKDWAWRTKPIIELRSDKEIESIDEESSETKPSVDLQTRKQIKECLLHCFEIRDEVRPLCADIGYSFDHLREAPFENQIDELISTLSRVGKLDELVFEMRKKRPDCPHRYM